MKKVKHSRLKNLLIKKMPQNVCIMLNSLILLSCGKQSSKLELAEKAQLELNNGNYAQAIKYSKEAHSNDPLNISIRYILAASYHGLAKLRPTDLLKSVLKKSSKSNRKMLEGVWGLNEAQRKITEEALKKNALPETFWLATEKMTLLNKAWRILCPFIPKDIMNLYSKNIIEILETKTLCIGGLNQSQDLSAHLVTEIIINNFALGTGLYQSFIDKDKNNIPDIVTELKGFSQELTSIISSINDKYEGKDPTHYLKYIEDLSNKIETLISVFNQNNLNLYALEFVYLKTTLELFK